MTKRKSLYDISWKVSESEYRSDKSFSYSTIARFDREGFNGLSRLYDRIETPSLEFGSLVDILITGTEEEFNMMYEIASFPNISDTLKQITKHLFTAYPECHCLEDVPEYAISEVAAMHDYYNNPKYKDYRIKKIKEECSEYFNLLLLVKNKRLISQEDYNDAVSCAEVLKSSEATKWYFEPDNPFDDSIERFYQLKFKGEYRGIPLRCMMDLVIVNHKTKEIIPVDLKTSGKKEWEFYKSFIEWRYYIQSQLYWELLRQNIEKDDYYKDYKLLDYRFIVINRFSKTPLIWEFEDTQVSTDTYYGENNKYHCRNWRTIVSYLNEYINNQHTVPIGINTSTSNSITTWLNHE